MKPILPAYFTRMPGCAPLSGASRKIPGVLPSGSEAASGAGEVAAPPVELTAEEKAEIARREALARKRAAERKKKEQEQERALARKRARLPLNSQTPFMEAGFVVTLADKVKQAGSTWWKTTRGGYVQASRVHRKQTQDFVGGEIPAEGRFAFGFVESERGGSASARDEKGALASVATGLRALGQLVRDAID